MNHLDRARENIQKASDRADGEVHTQLNSIAIGISGEEGGQTTQDDPGPKIDRVTQVADTLDGLDHQIDDAETREYVEEALEHIYAYMDDHPHGGHAE